MLSPWKGNGPRIQSGRLIVLFPWRPGVLGPWNAPVDFSSSGWKWRAGLFSFPLPHLGQSVEGSEDTVVCVQGWTRASVGSRNQDTGILGRRLSWKEFWAQLSQYRDEALGPSVALTELRVRALASLVILFIFPLSTLVCGEGPSVLGQAISLLGVGMMFHAVLINWLSGNNSTCNL